MDEIFPMVKALGINAISMFGDLAGPVPDHFKRAADEFEDVDIKLIHNPTYKNRSDWRDELRRDAKKTIAAYAEAGLHTCAWLLECNLYGYKWNPLVGCSRRFGSEINDKARCWLRTPCGEIPSEFVTKTALANIIRINIIGFAKDLITQIILKKQNPVDNNGEIYEDLTKAA